MPRSLLRPVALLPGVLLLLTLAGAPPAQAGPMPMEAPLPQSAPDRPDSLPVVHVLATGGTISNTEGDRLTGEELVRSLPGVERFARIEVEQFSNVASGSISLEQWLAMARRIDGLLDSRPEMAGVVVTHGTDTMEETAYFLDLTLGHCRPVVVTGAMRRASMLGADGPANLFNAIRLAVDEDARSIGAVVLMNDEIFSGRDAFKAHTSRMDAFTAPGSGRVGVTDPDRVVLDGASPRRTCGAPAFDLEGVDELPRVDIVYTYLGADGALIRAAAAAGARGVVVASVGRGGSTPGQRRAIQEVRQQGVVVVVGSRTGAGRVPVRRGGGAGEGTGAILGAGDLTPQKARILLMLALTRSSDQTELREIFERH